MGRASGGFGALRSRPWLAHGAFRYANDAPKRFPDASVPHEQLRKRLLSGRAAQNLYKTYYFFTFFVIALSTNSCPVWELWRAFWGSRGHLWRFFGFLGRAGLARDGSQEGQGRPKTAPRRSCEAGLGGLAFCKNRIGAPRLHFLCFGPFWDHFWVLFGTIFDVFVQK